LLSNIPTDFYFYIENITLKQKKKHPQEAIKPNAWAGSVIFFVTFLDAPSG